MVTMESHTKVETARAHENHMMTTPGAHHVVLVAVIGRVQTRGKRRQREEMAEASGGGWEKETGEKHCVRAGEKLSG
jgi:hypothetical protein